MKLFFLLQLHYSMILTVYFPKQNKMDVVFVSVLMKWTVSPR